MRTSNFAHFWKTVSFQHHLSFTLWDKTVTVSCPRNTRSKKLGFKTVNDLAKGTEQIHHPSIKFTAAALPLLPCPWQVSLTVLHCLCEYLFYPFNEHKRKAPSPGSRKETGQHKKLFALTLPQTIAGRESIQVSSQKKPSLKGKEETPLSEEMHSGSQQQVPALERPGELAPAPAQPAVAPLPPALAHM